MAIFQKRGAFWIDYYFEGKRIREKVGPNKTFARQALAKRKTEIAEKKFFPDRNKTSILFKDMAETFWQLYGQYKRGVSFPYMFKRVVAEFGPKRLDEITVPVGMDFLNKVRDSSSVANSNRYHTFLRSFFNRAIDWGKFERVNPFSKIKQGKESAHRLRFLSKEEIRRLLAACPPRIYPIVACALLTGLRRGEILNLTWETVDLRQNVLSILETKSGKPREIPMPPKLVPIFEGLHYPVATGAIFHVSQDILHIEFRKAVEKAGIPDFRFHDLRHTFASHFVMRTNDLPTLQKLLGHHSPTMTQRYTHLSKGHLQVGMLTFDAGMDVFDNLSHLKRSYITA